ncbi:MAG: hypothetical protein PHD37_06680 [Gallionellaceae bacterium]|nr:hypothetical protein [Gallionellaceae bacterium]
MSMVLGLLSHLSGSRPARAARAVGAHVPNPDHLADRVEPRARALVAGLERYGAGVFASCAGHGGGGRAPYWPHFAFHLDLERARALAEYLHDNPALAYRWAMVGHFMPRYGFDLGLALSIHDRQKFDVARVDADLGRLAGWVQAMGAGEGLGRTSGTNNTGRLACHAA